MDSWKRFSFLQAGFVRKAVWENGPEKNDQEWVKVQFERILPNCDIVIGGIRDLIELMDLPLPTEVEEPAEILETVSQQFVEKYDVALFAGTLREKDGKNRNIKGFLRHKNQFVLSSIYDLDIYDRIGTGDAYASGIITGFIEKWSDQRTVDFATGNAVLAHTTFGDSPIIRKERVEAFISGQIDDVIR